MSILQLLIGAALVIAGVLTSALADRIRGLRILRPTTGRPVGTASKLTGAWKQIADEPSKRDRFSEASDADKRLGAEVAEALTHSGWRPTIAKSATWLCEQSERLTLESWTRAALKNCALMDKKAIRQ